MIKFSSSSLFDEVGLSSSPGRRDGTRKHSPGRLGRSGQSPSIRRGLVSWSLGPGTLEEPSHSLVDCASLLMRLGFMPLAGSNPVGSAKTPILRAAEKGWRFHLAYYCVVDY